MLFSWKLNYTYSIKKFMWHIRRLEAHYTFINNLPPSGQNISKIRINEPLVRTRYTYQQVDIEKALHSILKRFGLGWKISKVIWKLYQERSTSCYKSTSSTQGQISSSWYFPRSTYVQRWIFLIFKTTLLLHCVCLVMIHTTCPLLWML